MSVDWKHERICNHQIVEETATLEPDLRTIRFPRQISSDEIRLFVNCIVVPRDHPRWGFTIQDDELSVEPRKKRKIVINKASKATDDLISVTYFTRAQACPKCHGLLIHDDIEWDASGRPILVADARKLTQEVKKGVITVLGSNPFHTWIGTRIATLIGNKVISVQGLRASILDEVVKFIESYTSIQRKQIQAPQDVTPKELFLRLIEVRVEQLFEEDPTIFSVSIRFQDGTGEASQVDMQLVLPAA